MKKIKALILNSCAINKISNVDLDLNRYQCSYITESALLNAEFSSDFDILIVASNLFDTNLVQNKQNIDKVAKDKPRVLIIKKTTPVVIEMLKNSLYDYVLQEDIKRLPYVIDRLVNTAKKEKDFYKLEVKLKQKVVEASLIYDLTRSLREASNLEEALQIYLNKVCPIIHWPVGHVFIPDTSRNVLKSSLVWYVANPEKMVEFKKVTNNIQFSMRQGLPGCVYQKQAIVWVDDITEEDDFIRAKLCGSLALKSGVAIPVFMQDKIVAVIEFFSFHEVVNKASLTKIFMLISEQISFVLEKCLITKEYHKIKDYDSVTNLPNKEKLRDYVKSHASKMTLQAFGVVIFDIDDFNRVNNTYGYEAGDALLTQLAKRLRDHANEIGMLARIGANSFLIFIDNCQNESALITLTETMLKDLIEPYYANHKEINITLSAGMAMNKCSANEGLDDLINHAEVALYQAKISGKNNYSIYSEKISERNNQAMQVKNYLRHGIEHNEFTLLFHPIISIKSGKIAGFEVLIRWENSELGAVSPLEFIPVAESSGFIIELGDWIIRDALKQYQAIQAIDVNNSIFMTINVSVLQFEDASFVDKLAREVEQFQINPKLIVLEITETKLMNNIQNMLPFFNTLNKKGFRLAIDDFGTGYSSLNYIKQLPLNFIKIDKSFVDAIPADQNDISIVKAIIEMGKAFELEIIAEGVEYQAQAQCLLEQSCEYAQGYLYHKPLSYDQLIKVVNDGLGEESF